MILKQIGKYFKWQAEMGALSAINHYVTDNFTDAQEIQDYHRNTNNYSNVKMRMTDTSLWMFYFLFSIIGLFVNIIGVLPTYKGINISFYICIILIILFALLIVRKNLRLNYYNKLVEYIIIMKIRKISVLAKKMNKDRMKIIEDLMYVASKKYIIDLYIDEEKDKIILGNEPKK